RAARSQSVERHARRERVDITAQRGDHQGLRVPGVYEIVEHAERIVHALRARELSGAQHAERAVGVVEEAARVERALSAAARPASAAAERRGVPDATIPQAHEI